MIKGRRGPFEVRMDVDGFVSRLVCVHGPYIFVDDGEDVPT